MDDLKLISKSEEKLQKQIHRVKIFTDYIHMEFGLEKFTQVTFKRRKLISSQNLVVDNHREIQELEELKTYKYLGIEESEGIQHQKIKDSETGIQQTIKNDTEI
jgi:hypothetical protein